VRKVARLLTQALRMSMVRHIAGALKLQERRCG
jgi:hypothetical protein